MFFFKGYFKSKVLVSILEWLIDGKEVIFKEIKYNYSVS